MLGSKCSLFKLVSLSGGNPCFRYYISGYCGVYTDYVCRCEAVREGLAERIDMDDIKVFKKSPPKVSYNQLCVFLPQYLSLCHPIPGPQPTISGPQPIISGPSPTISPRSPAGYKIPSPHPPSSAPPRNLRPKARLTVNISSGELDISPEESLHPRSSDGGFTGYTDDQFEDLSADDLARHSKLIGKCKLY